MSVIRIDLSQTVMSVAREKRDAVNEKLLLGVRKRTSDRKVGLVH